MNPRLPARVARAAAGGDVALGLGAPAARPAGGQPRPEHDIAAGRCEELLDPGAPELSSVLWSPVAGSRSRAPAARCAISRTPVPRLERLAYTFDKAEQGVSHPRSLNRPWDISENRETRGTR